MTNFNINSLIAVVIVHGKSEKELVNRIKKAFKLNILVLSKNNGRNCIQINTLASEYINNKFKSTLLDCCCNNKKSIDFKIFTIMDVDDLKKDESDIKNSYINDGIIPGVKSKKIKEKLSPIFCDGNLEDVLIPILGSQNIPKNNKEKKMYHKIFEEMIPLNMSREEFLKLYRKFKKVHNKSNIYLLFELCLRHID